MLYGKGGGELSSFTLYFPLGIHCAYPCSIPPVPEQLWQPEAGEET